MKRIVLLLFFVFISQLSFAETKVVKNIIGIDLMEAEDGSIIRLIGVDPALQASDSSAEFLYRLKGAEVRLEYDAHKYDDKGFLLAYVFSLVCKGDCSLEAVQGQWYERLDDGWYEFVNASVVYSGQTDYFIDPDSKKYDELFKKVKIEAQNNNRGLWVRPLDSSIVFCPADVRECPDGSFVSRIPPGCEFALCP